MDEGAMAGGDEPVEHVLVLGIGNLLWADEGFGIRAAEALNARYALPECVRVIDGGTQGVYLLPYVQTAARMIVFDAVDFRLAPGRLVVLRGDEIPAWLGVHKMSLHQSSFQEVLALASLTGSSPSESVLIGVQPAELADFGGSLSEVVRSRIPQALEAALEVLGGWGIAAAARSEVPIDGLSPASLSLAAYEGERPQSSVAFRGGDARFLNTLIEDC